MPKEILLTIIWDDISISMSNYSMYRPEIQETIRNYGLENTQAELFTYLPLDSIRQWLSDVFAKDAYEIVVEQIFY